MATIEERAQAIVRAADAIGDLHPLTETEFLRQQDVAVARRLGLPAPRLRTSLDLRFYGPAVSVHDLGARAAGIVIVRISELLEDASLRVSSIKGPVKIFVSPVVSPGSTVLTLFGEGQTVELDHGQVFTEIPETPMDQTLGLVFKSIETVIAAPEEARPGQLNIDGRIGDRIFRLADELVQQNLSLDLGWTRASGRATYAEISRPAAEHMRSVLNVPTREVKAFTDAGVLQQINVDGTIKVAVEGRAWKIVEMVAPAADLERLRQLWGMEVVVKYQRIVTKHPQRSQDAREYEFVAIRRKPPAQPDTLV